MEKRKRIFIEPSHFAQAIKIGESKGEPVEAALIGIIRALEHYEKTKDVDMDLYRKLEIFWAIDPSVINNMEALLVLSKNSNLSSDEVGLKINKCLKMAISEVLGV